MLKLKRRALKFELYLLIVEKYRNPVVSEEE